MSKENRFPTYIKQLQTACIQAQSHIEGLSFDDFIEQPVYSDAAMMQIIVIGKVARKILDNCPSTAALHNDIPWHSMTGIRNRAVHDYHHINYKIIWNTLTIELPNLMTALENIQFREQ